MAVYRPFDADTRRDPWTLDAELRDQDPVHRAPGGNDTEVAGTPIAAGDRVLLCYGSATRDPREFGPTADRLDVGRDIPRLLAISSGPHHCLGAAVARSQTRAVLEELLARCPGSTVDAVNGRFAHGAFTRRYHTLPFTP